MKKFEKYTMFDVKGNLRAVDKSDKAFRLFEEEFNHHYGAIEKLENLVSIHTGGWSENESLVRRLSQTWWWFLNYRGTMKGGHYYLELDRTPHKSWSVIPQKKPTQGGRKNKQF